MFSNDLVEDDLFNIIEYLYFYNGGGVAVGDVNNDGLADIYLTSNQQSNKLFINKGGFRFEDVTSRAGVGGKGNWTTGVSMADVNGDGFLDIYVCGVGGYKKFNGRNQLFINQKDGTFVDLASECNLDFQGFSTHSVFFDYDNDGDLDMFLLNHSVHSTRSYGDGSIRFQHDLTAGDKLYRNELVPSGKLFFVDVTTHANIHSSQIGYGLGVGVSDFNSDGWMDIYVTNDFHEHDYLYLNQGDGTFRQVIEEATAHTSRFSMGCDIADVNHDGRTDILTLDMLPNEESVIKSSAAEDPYDIFLFKQRYGYHPQLARNCLQINNGPIPDQNTPYFSDVAPYVGVEATDWSWSGLIADFDNSGSNDIFISNGIVRRPNNMDYISYISARNTSGTSTNKAFVAKMPEGKVPNVLYFNIGPLEFKEADPIAMDRRPSFSNGAAYADLDNDGDLDLVVNNLNEEAFLIRNNQAQDSFSFMRVSFNGRSPNTFGIGTKVFVFANGKVFFREQVLSRGWQSSVDPTIHIGLGNITMVDSIQVIWPDGHSETRREVKVNQSLVFQQETSTITSGVPHKQSRFFKAVDHLRARHIEDNFNSFDGEPLIPTMATHEGPGMTIGDVDGDRLIDIFLTGGPDQSGKLFLQRSDGSFVLSDQQSFHEDSFYEDVVSDFIDVDDDGDLDLLVGSGGQNPQRKTGLRLYLNDKSIFRKSEGLPDLPIEVSCIASGDIDGDGRPDIFVGARSVPGRYGIDPKSLVLINAGNGKFIDKTDEILSESKGTLGMVTDAVSMDLDDDGASDLIIVGEWMPITILLQRNGKLVDYTKQYGLDKTDGWWNSIHTADLNNDGRSDLVIGNFGENSRLKASYSEPLDLFISDVDGNGSMEPIMTYYNNGKQYPFLSRDAFVRQVPSSKKQFASYRDFSQATIDDLLRDPANILKRKSAFMLSSVVVLNFQDGLTLRRLPMEAQLFPIFAIEHDDVDKDGKIDLLLFGNSLSNRPDIGLHDAGYGLVLAGDGQGNFRCIKNTGLFVKGEARDTKVYADNKEQKFLVIAVNNDTLKVFKFQ